MNRQLAKSCLIAVVLAVCAFSSSAQTVNGLSTNNVIVNFAAFGVPATSISSVTVQGCYSFSYGGTYYYNAPVTLGKYNYPAITNGYAVFTNLLCGVPYTVTLSGYATYATNFTIPATTQPDGNGNISAYTWVGSYSATSRTFTWANPSVTNYLIGMGATNVVTTNGTSIIIGQTLYLNADTNGAAAAVQVGVVSGSIVAAQATHATNADLATNLVGASVTLTGTNGASTASFTTAGVLNLNLQTNSTSSGGVTNGAANDALANSFCVSNKITDYNTQVKVQKFVQHGRAAGWLTNMQCFFPFAPIYNPTNHRDLLGQTGTFVNGETYGYKGLLCLQTNQFRFVLPTALTNWTVCIVKRNAGNPFGYPLGAGGNDTLYLDWSLETTNNGDGVFNGWGGVNFRSRIYQVSGTNLMLPSYNPNNTPPYVMNMVKAKDYGDYPSPIFMAVYTFEGDNAGHIYGWCDGLPLRMNGSTNLCQSTGTNTSPLQVLNVAGSTNWSFIITATNGYNPVRSSTNSFLEVASVGVFNGMFTPAQVADYYTAAHELDVSPVHYIFLGTSMLQDENRINYLGLTSLTNGIAWNFQNHFPLANVHNYSQGGSDVYTIMTNGTTALPYPTTVLTGLPQGSIGTVFSDSIRNDIAGTTVNPGGTNSQYWSSKFAAAFAPWKANGFALVAIETPISATNSPNTFTDYAQTNLVNGWINSHTNADMMATFDGYVPIISRLTYSLMTTNANHYFLADNQGGQHIEGDTAYLYFAWVASQLVPTARDWDWLAQPTALTVSVGASPFTYRNTFSWPEQVTITGGTVSGVTLDGVSLGAFTGSLRVERGSVLVVTYSSTPTMTWLQTR